MKFDHVALQSKDIQRSIAWYQDHFDCEVLYQDDTWAMINVCGLNLSFVTPSQHPAHIAFCVTNEEEIKKYKDKNFKTHRDGTKSFYMRDDQNNILEIVVRPGDEKD
mgnify:FL=1|tara:strand:- start:729 stop:1049 length:321 start_codon:yes stop_codon:yes gene_type:complete